MPHHLDRIPDALRARLSPEARRQLADLDLDQQRRRRDRAAGTAPLPDFLHTVDAEALGAGRLYTLLPANASTDEARQLGARFGLDADAVDLALDALARHELAIRGPAGFTTVPPGGVPF